MNYIHNNEFMNPFGLLTNGNIPFATPVGENNIDLISYIERTKAYIEEYKYNLSLAVSKFKLNNAIENNVDEDFFFNVLIENGAICGFSPANLSEKVIFQPYEARKWNYYAKPTEVTIIPYFKDGVTLKELGLESNNLLNDDFNIVYLNKAHIGFAQSLSYEARIYSMLNMCLINNIFAKSLQLVLQGRSDELNDIQRILNKIFNQNGILAIDTESKPDINELIKAVELPVEWLGDKVNECKKQIRAELHERLGITHTPYEKKERLIEIEIETQNEASDLLAQSTLDTVNSGLEIINKKFELEYPLSVSFTNIGIDNSNTENINEVKEIV